MKCDMNENQYDVPHQISRRGPGEVTLGPETAPPFFYFVISLFFRNGDGDLFSIFLATEPPSSFFCFIYFHFFFRNVPILFYY